MFRLLIVTFVAAITELYYRSTGVYCYLFKQQKWRRSTE